MVKRKFEVVPIDRLQEFFIYCDHLEKHKFFKRYGEKAKKLYITANFPEKGRDTAKTNIDEILLESYLTRLRQFLFENELFYYKDLSRSVIAEFGSDIKFNSFYNKLVAAINRPYIEDQVKVYKADGKLLYHGKTFKHLMEARLYGGAIHSALLVNPTSDQSVIRASHIHTKKHLIFRVGQDSLTISKNIFAFRNWILRLARNSGKTDLFPELKKFDKRSKRAGC